MPNGKKTFKRHEKNMANAIVRVSVRDTYVECVFFSSPNTILQNKQSNSSRKPTHANLNMFSVCTSGNHSADSSGCGRLRRNATFNSHCVRFQKLSLRPAAAKQSSVFGGGTHKSNLRSGCGKTFVSYMRKRRLKSSKQTECLPGASYVR